MCTLYNEHKHYVFARAQELAETMQSTFKTGVLTNNASKSITPLQIPLYCSNLAYGVTQFKVDC